MDNHTGYIINAQNAELIANLTGKPLKIIAANIGWVAVYSNQWMPSWRLMPKNAAEMLSGFAYADSPLNGLPTRTIPEIIHDRSELNHMYSTRLAELNAEMERAKLKLDSQE